MGRMSARGWIESASPALYSLSNLTSSLLDRSLILAQLLGYANNLTMIDHCEELVQNLPLRLPRHVLRCFPFVLVRHRPRLKRVQPGQQIAAAVLHLVVTRRSAVIESGVDVVVGLYNGSKSWAKAEEAGLKVMTTEDANFSPPCTIRCPTAPISSRLFTTPVSELVSASITYWIASV